MNPHFYGSKSTIKKAKIFKEKMTVSSINGVGKTGQLQRIICSNTTFSISIIKIIKMDYFSYHKKDSWESLGLQGDPTSQSSRKSVLNIPERTMLKLKLQYSGHLMQRADSFERPWFWERLKTGGEGDDSGWDGWMASLTQWTWIWVSSRSWSWTGSLACCSPWGHKESDRTEQLN